MLVALVATGAAHAATFVVSTTADAGDGSLRQAIDDANAAGDADTIEFAIADGGVPTITVATNLPAITSPVVLDATTQSPAGRVELTGTTSTGLTITGTDVTVRGFVVNGFTTAGIAISGPGGAIVEGNAIGTNVAGTASASPSTAAGITIAGTTGNRIGGYDASARNLISGNGTGIWLSGSTTTGNVIVGNWIGTDASGLAALPNASDGISSFLSGGNTIGGTATGAGNVVAGNGNDGMALSGSGFVVQGNWVGVGADGVTAVPNGRHGIRIFNGSGGALVGGAGPNVVAYNAGAGVLVALNGGVGNTISSNVIHDNGALGIDIDGSGVNLNDAGDVDTGSNLGQNFPVLDAAFAGGNAIAGTLDSTPFASFTIELFAGAACDASGYGEGTELVGSIGVVADATGHVAFLAPLSRGIGASEYVTATATDAAGNTSELSLCAPTPPSTTTSTSTSTSTSSTAPATTSSSTTLAAPSTTTSTPAPPSTTSTSSPGGSTTSTTSTIPDTTTTSTPPPSSTTTLLAADTTTTTAPAGSSTTSTTGVAASTTTSTTASTTSLPAGTTTSTTAPDASTTTSTTDVPVSSTSTTVPDPETTTSTTAAGATTSTSTTVPAGTTSTTAAEATTTSTTDAAATTTTSTSAPDTTSTTSTSAVASTTTSTTDPSATTTTSSSTTSTSDPAPTTSSSAPSTSTTSTSAAPTSSTSSSAVPTTSSTAAVASTTSTTLPSCDTPDCPARCGREIAFAPLRCRLHELTTTIDATRELAPMRGVLDRHLGKAELLFDKAEVRCDGAKRAPAKRSLRLVRRRLGRVGKTLRRRLVRRTVAAAVTEPLARSTAALAGDVRALSTTLTCR